MDVREIIKAKGAAVETIHPDATLRQAIRKLCEKRIGSLLVMGSNGDSGRPVGILTERDILRQCDAGADLDRMPVGEAMVTKLIVGLLHDDVQRAMATMTEHRIRHLPVLDERTGQVAGLLSIGDVVGALLEEDEAQVRYYHDYICR